MGHDRAKRSEAEYKAVAAFYGFISKPEQVSLYAQHTGYVPVTVAGYEATKQSGYFDKNPGTDVPARQLSRGELTPNSRGLRLGRLPEIRAILYEEIEKASRASRPRKRRWTAPRRGATASCASSRSRPRVDDGLRAG